MKQRIVIRLHLAVRAVLQSEADWRGTRLGTLTSELIHEQAAKARLCGVQNYELNPELRTGLYFVVFSGCFAYKTAPRLSKNAVPPLIYSRF